MCGIAGAFHYAQPGFAVDLPLLQAMTRCLAHRGPDGESFHVEPQLGFGHRRLSIVDLSPTGAQPMSTEDGSCWITYNGEFYNHASFRPRLIDKGYRFRGTSDTETLLNLYHCLGTSFLADVAGIFAFAIWDRRSRCLVLARDPLGVKQIYCHDDGRRLLFASEIKALLADPVVPRELDPEALNEYLHFHTPLHDRTFFKGIWQLRPGEILEVAAAGRSSRTYWTLEPEPAPRDDESAIRDLRTRLEQIVADQLMSDVPVGAFFSGGIDSSAVASFAKRAGRPPRCFGVHFTGQGVIDERPYQEAAAKALGLDLELVTLTGDTFADDLPRLLRSQDEPVIGPAMFSMDRVAALAAGRVKVCLGGQGADEIFGGYARYALMEPMQVLTSLFTSGGERGAAAPGRVGGNLWKQMVDPAVFGRLLRTVNEGVSWRHRYFGTVAKVPEAAWRSIFASGIVSRRTCRESFFDSTSTVKTVSPADAAMRWDLATYLPGLFHQDDRMSMAHGLESRVPMADPRLVRFAFSLGNHLRFRAGASKWALRRAVADALPADVLTRRKVGFDTPIDLWIRHKHLDFVKEILLSTTARSRGIWDGPGLHRLLSDPRRPHWLDMVWKALCIEVWAREFLGSTPRDTVRPAPSNGHPRDRAILRDSLQEVRELGLAGTLFRVGWEARVRTGLMAKLEKPIPAPDYASSVVVRMRQSSPFAESARVTAALRSRIPAADLDRLKALSDDAAHGRILCFGRWMADYGFPIDWHLNPTNGKRWDPAAHWTRVLAAEDRIGDVKLTWEIGRFPHAYHLARASAWLPEFARTHGSTFATHVRGFVQANPCPLGVHWASGQEVAIRLMAWQFALGVFQRTEALPDDLLPLMARATFQAASHIERHIDYSRKSVFNNHVIGEALGLYLASRLLPEEPRTSRWRKTGMELLIEHADRQFSNDGAYIQNSHNYHRVALHYLLTASACARVDRTPVPREWSRAMERSLDFLLAHQNRADGRLPNYGANDGAMPLILTTCDYSDFRPLLQAVSLQTRGERLYEPGPWDEGAAWLLGPEALDAPLRPRQRTLASFRECGYHVLATEDPGTFATFRCGSLKERFSQIDMLHVDFWLKGRNLLVDGGSYLYNGPAEWHDYFLTTSSHNTVSLDGRDQMLHYRRFKSLYRTRARLLTSAMTQHGSVMAGEHHGYARHAGGAIHRRSLLLAKSGWLVVVDTVRGEGEHTARLHWLCGAFPHRYDPAIATLLLAAGDDEVAVRIFDHAGAPLVGSVVAGSEDPPRGWQSRYYGEKVPVPSLSVERTGELPLTFVTIVAPRALSVLVTGHRWTLGSAAESLSFEIMQGLFERIQAVT